MTINVWVGFDQREAAAFAVTAQSLIETASVPVAIKPLTLKSLPGFTPHSGGSNQFITSRYLIPALEDFSGWALFVDSDILFLDDIAKLWALRDDRYAVQAVWHEYKTTSQRKYIGTPIEADNIDYPKKNFSSVVMFNCSHPANRILTPEYVQMQPSKYLHRFEWLNGGEIGALPGRWNHLVMEEPLRKDAAIAHFTLGSPGFSHYVDCEYSREWHATFLRANQMIGEDVAEMARRAKERG